MSKNAIIDQEIIDEDQNIKMILRSNSPMWYVQFNLPGVGQRRTSLKTTKVKEARRRARQFANKFAESSLSFQGHQRMTVREVFEHRIDRLKTRQRAGQTLKIYGRFAELLMAYLPRGGDTPMDHLTVAVLEGFENRLREVGIALPSPTGRGKRKARPMGPGSLRDAMSFVRSLIRFAIKRQWLMMDPCSAYELPPKVIRKVEVFSEQTLKALYEDPEPGMADIWRVLTETCLRAGEFIWLLKEDVVLDDQGRPEALQIRGKVCPITGKKWRPKHGTDRVVVLNPRVSGIVAAALKTSGGPWLFEACTRTGTGQWTDNTLRRRLYRRLEAIGAERAGLHRFRHTGATYMANAGTVPIVQLQSFLGHRDLRDTMRYLNPRAEHVSQSISRVDFDRLINNKAPAGAPESADAGKEAHS